MKVYTKNYIYKLYKIQLFIRALYVKNEKASNRMCLYLYKNNISTFISLLYAYETGHKSNTSRRVARVYLFRIITII